MSKYSEELIVDYIYGNDIEDYDIDDLENDYKFMMEVIKYSKDKNMYDLCSDEVKQEYEFVKFMIEMFKEDVNFIISIAHNYLDNANESDITYKEIVVLISNLTDANKNEDAIEFKLKSQIMSEAELVEIAVVLENSTDEKFKEKLGLGFIYIMEKYGNSKILMDFFANQFIANIFYYSDENHTLEEYIHLNVKDKNKIIEPGINNFIIGHVGTFDSALAGHISNNIVLIEHLHKNIEKIVDKWDYYMETLSIRREKIVEQEVFEFMNNNNIHVDFSVYKLINYILSSLGFKPLDDDVFSETDDELDLKIYQKLQSGQNLDFTEYKLVSYLTNLIKELYEKDVIVTNLNDYDEINISENNIIDFNSYKTGSKK